MHLCACVHMCACRQSRKQDDDTRLYAFVLTLREGDFGVQRHAASVGTVVVSVVFPPHFQEIYRKRTAT